MKKPRSNNTNGGDGKAIFNNDRGSALLMTLGVLLLMLVIGLGFMYSAVTERQVAANQAEAAKARNLAESGLQRGLAILNKNLTSPGSAAARNTAFSPLSIALFDSSGYYTFPSGEDFAPALIGTQQIGCVKVEIINRTGKIDPNWWGRPSKRFRTPWAGPNKLLGDADDDANQWGLVNWDLPAVGWSPVGMEMVPSFGGAETPAQYLAKNDRLFVADPMMRKMLRRGVTETPDDYFHGALSDFSDPGKEDPMKWFSREQGLAEIKKSVPSADFSQNSDPTAADFNRDILYPYSPTPVVYASGSGSSFSLIPEPATGGSNTFIDWGANWRDLTKTPNIRLRVPVEYLASLDFAAADGTNDVRFLSTVPYFGTSATPANRDLGLHLPWFRALKAQRAASGDMASYYELVANLKDYLNSATVPTTNLWPIPDSIKIVDLSGNYTVVSQKFIEAKALSNSVNVVPYPYCGNKALPNLSEIRLDFDTRIGVGALQAEIVNLYPEQFSTPLLNLAEVVEIEFTDGTAPATVNTYIQKFVVGFGKTSNGTGAQALKPLTLSSPVICRRLASTDIPSPNGLTGPVKVTRIRLYLMQNIGIGDEIGSLSDALLDKTLRDPAQTTLLDVATLDMKTPISVFFASSNALGCIIGDLSVTSTKDVGYGELKNGDIYYIDEVDDKKGNVISYGTVAYIVMEKHKPADVDIPCNPQPVRETPYTRQKPITTVFKTALPTSRWLVADGQLYVNPLDGELKMRWTPDDINIACRNPPPPGKSLWTCVSIFAAGSSSVYLETLDPRCNTKLTYSGSDAWKSSTYGSMGTVNPDWWKSVPISPAWAPGLNAYVGDRFTYGGLDYEVTVAHNTNAANTPDKTTSCYTPISPSESSGRDYWMGLTKANEDAVVKPANGVMAAKGITTASQMVTTYIRPSTAFIRYGKPLSLWEIGAVSRAEPWRTIRLVDGALDPTGTAPFGSYEFGDWMLLDELSLHVTDAYPAAYAAGEPLPYKSERGKMNINPDTIWADGVRQSLSGLVSMSTKDLATPVEAYCHRGITISNTTCPVLATALFDPLSLAIPGSVSQPTGAQRGAPLLSRGELAVRQTGAVPSGTISGLAMVDWYNTNGFATDTAGRNIRQLDRCREELIGKSANLFQTRYQYFEIIATGRSQKEKPDAAGKKVMLTLAEQKVTSVVERDTYTGKVRLFIGGRPQQE